MLHYNPQYVSNSTLLIFRRTNCIITASGIVTVCKRPYNMPVESGLQSALNRHIVRPLPDTYPTGIWESLGAGLAETENFASTRFQLPDLPTRSEPPHRLLYPGRQYSDVCIAVFPNLFDVAVPWTSLFMSHGTP